MNLFEYYFNKSAKICKKIKIKRVEESNFIQKESLELL